MATDHLGRKIDYLRISVTDRCNYRCLYCMPEEGVKSINPCEILSMEEISRFVRIVAGEGISTIRLTGGEPLVRKGIIDLVRQIKEIDGIKSLAMTTNGSLLPKMARDLKDAGLDRVNISLDTLDANMFSYLTRRGTLEEALAGIDTAFEVGFDPVKLNSVVIRSINQDFPSFVRLTLDRPIHVRFIEFMPVGHQAGVNDAGWNESDVIPSDELRAMIDSLCESAGLGRLVPVDSASRPDGLGPANYYRLPGAKGTIGFISSLSNHFCSSCNRMRLTADGCLRPCLFSDDEYSVREALRNGSDEDVLRIFYEALHNKPDSHHNRVGTDRNMSKIGG